MTFAAVSSFRPSYETSFPYLRVALLFDVPYSTVLNYVSILEYPGGADFAPPVEQWHHATLWAFRLERQRREGATT